MLKVFKIQRLNLSMLASGFQNKLLPLAALHPHFKFLSDLWHWCDLLISMSATCCFNWVPQTWLSCTAEIMNNLSDNVMSKLKNSLQGAATGDCSFAQKQQKQRQGRCATCLVLQLMDSCMYMAAKIISHFHSLLENFICQKVKKLICL